MNEFRIYKGISSKSGGEYFKLRLAVDGKEIKQDIFDNSLGVIAQVVELMGGKIYSINDDDEE